MAYFIREIKFFEQNGELFAALFEAPPLFCSEFWVMNVPIQALGITKLPESIYLEQKYPLEVLGIRPLYFTAKVRPVSFVDPSAAAAWTS